ncbi:hypothetical protein BX600DRAFT_514253 [Xylariales sp. PMI_506]|nr:hypothetical protein BX600DRAFT_514253 [Xylariales sp. PMI_506]
MSFPVMVKRRETLPPFIHPTMLSGADEDDCTGSSSSSGSSDLLQCMSLAQTWSFEHPQTRAFVWRHVRASIEKWWSNHQTYTNRQLLACQQALLIYTLMRMSEGSGSGSRGACGYTPNPVIDEPLLMTLVIVSKTLVERVGNAEFIHGTLHPVRSWGEWVFNESRRRLATLARLINFVVDIDSAVKCYLLPGYVLVPLPSGRSTWEAGTAAAWRSEYDLSAGVREVYALGADGKLKKLLQQGIDGQLLAREARWEDYLSYENGFGMMVMIAGSMIETSS